MGASPPKLEVRLHRFDQVLAGSKAAHPWDQVVAETASFVVCPSLGSLVPGWLLLLPKSRRLNLRGMRLSEWVELDDLARSLEPKLTIFASDVFCFEHGNATDGGPMGCGVDHAHMHMVPLSFDLIEAAIATNDPCVEWQQIAGTDCFQAAIPDQGEYMSIWHPRSGRGAIGKVRRPQSQWIRRVIARHLGKPKHWDYRANSNLPNIMATVRAFRQDK